ncbi:hypothetical protein ACSBR2_034523 [Camellia fascicularis]
MRVSVCKFGHQAYGHQFIILGFSLPEGQRFSSRANQCFFTRGRVKRAVRHRSSVQQSVQRALSTPPEYSRDQSSVSPVEREHIPDIQLDQGSMAGMEGMVRQLQESMKSKQEDAARQVEFAKQQAAIMAQQAELITRLQQQNGASASHQAPSPPRVPIPGETPNVQEGTGVPTGPAPPPILPQLSKTPTNLPDSSFEFEVDPTALKVSKLEKLFKKSQGVKSIPDIEDGFTDSAVTLPDRFKMPHIDRFDGSGDPIVHLHLFSDILRPMGLTTA